MSYIGNTPFTAAFQVDTFSGNGSTVAFTMSVAPANTSSVLVSITGVVQDPSTYSVSGTTLTFSQAPPSGTSNISVRYLGIPASGVTTTAYRTQTEFTATAGQTTFTVPSYTVGYIDVYRNGLLLGSADFTATTGTTVVLAAAASAGDFIETVSFYVSSVLNAIQQYNGLSVNQVLTSPTANTLTSASGSNLQLQTNGGTTAMTFDTAQNAGLGVTPSAWGSGYVAFENKSGALYAPNLSQVTLIQNAYYNGSNFIFRSASSQNASRYQQNNGEHSWYYSGAGTAGGTVSFTQAMTLDASGNLGLNTSSPTAKFYIKQSANGFGDGIRLERSNAANYWDFVTGGDDSLYVGYKGSTKAVIDSSGNWLLGCTTSRTGNSSLSFEAGNSGIFFRQTGTGAFTQVVFTRSTDTTPTSAGFISTTSTTTTYSTSSDYRLKENVAPMVGALAVVSQLRPVNYTWKSSGVAGQGFIAHELQEVVPDAVVGEKDAVDADGNPVYQGVDTSFLVATLTAAIQEQQAIITQLQADVAALKGQA